MSAKAVREIIRLEKQTPAPGFEMFGFRHADIDPFIDVTLFWMSRPIFPPHPHAGFSAVTYMTPESRGAFINRDSLGDRTEIRPGDTHWTQAGAGMMHEETPSKIGIPCKGFQMFVKLDASEELSPPEAFHLNAAETPLLNGAGWTGRVICGRANEMPGGLQQTRHDAFLIDVAAEPDADVRLRLKAGASAWAFIRDGAVRVGDDTIDAVSAIVLSQGGAQISFSAGPHGASMLIGGGKPLREPIVSAGPFALSTRERLTNAQRRYADGEMGRLAPSF